MYHVYLLANSNLDDIQDHDPPTAKCDSFGVDERDVLENQKAESSSHALSDNHPTSQETELSVSTSPPTTGKLIDEDEVG